MGNRIAAMGRAGTLRSLAQVLRERRERGAIEEEEGIRIPLPEGRKPEKAVETPIGERVGGYSTPEGTSEMAVAQERYDTVKEDVKREAENQITAVSELPVMKNLDPYPTAQNRLMQLAKANDWIQDVGGVPTISLKNQRIAQKIIARDLNLRKEVNELALGDLTQQIGALKQSILDPKMKDEERAAAQQQIATLTEKQNVLLNTANMMDRELQRRKALQGPPKEEAAKTITTDKGIMQWNPKTKRYDIPAGKVQDKTKGKFALVDPSKYTPESVKKFEETGKQSDLRAVDKTGGRGKKRPVGDKKAANKSILDTILSVTDIEAGGLFDEVKGSINEGLLRQRLRQGGLEGEREDYKELAKVYTKIKQFTQRNLRDTEMTIEDSVVDAFRQAGVEHLLPGYEEPEVASDLPEGATRGDELVQFEQGDQKGWGYPVYDAKGTVIGWDQVK